MGGYNLPDNCSASDPEAPWNKDENKGEQEEVCTCPEDQPEDERLELVDIDCPIHGLTEEQKQTV